MPDYTLYAYYRSSCSARLRIILNLKNISYDQITVNLLKGEQLSPEHKALNPSASVPLLISNRAPDAGFKIGQSVAALEYLEEVHPLVPALPPTSDAKGRATVRALCQVIAADVQPVTNLRIMRRVRALGGDAEEWNRDLMGDGLAAYEAVAKDSAGKYSLGDDVTMADASLMPALWNAQRYGVDLSQFPTISKIFDNLSAHPAVQKAHYFVQPDCPEELRKE
ncbi:maleylacetoacetate isomerase [Metarhizium album ARSEF 1941]|uniref:Maleylacetoacetate isomerase n=1 Tax=Metarhizium album (strain ARSEF 1941) TaxID=1081103 RepID=A0A0B2WG94_METAS|nr:maleylacetoacetate isomerase [Metarhizium album ARSEF 1941]KHN95021.1 maleylacetoacetate isomerase [Metarhizium album ARSEF 1941]